ncbi:hypothetical protein GUJ93_ZPchr0001g30089 [Zizania palustris]|uniref:Secreted protein n=1 Tax=Zizania palustris TaxID=103762 RepID=A0A8J5SGC1_ZIZPA|nr:hypothetical protein GUJ93_ZPchr0001g30089 [Zizania palustris]
MGWLRSLLSLLRRLWCCHMNAVHREKRGIYILYDDVKSCPCEDVHVLWSILVESSHGLPPPAVRPTRPAAPHRRPLPNKEKSSWRHACLRSIYRR